MRRGFSIIETLTVLAIFTSVSVVFAGLFRTLLRDIPVVQKNYQTNTSIQHMLNRMRSDVDTAQNISLSSDENKSLLLKNSNTTVCYQLADRKLSRTVSDSPDKTEIWPLPDAVIKWNIRQKDGRGYALEVRTAVEYIINARKQRRLANSYMFFAGTFSGTGKAE